MKTEEEIWQAIEEKESKKWDELMAVMKGEGLEEIRQHAKNVYELNAEVRALEWVVERFGR